MTWYILYAHVLLPYESLGDRISLLHYISMCIAGKMTSEPCDITSTYFWWEHSCILQRYDSHQVTSSLVGKNVLCAYGKSAQTARRTERVLAMLLPFLLCSLRCINLLYMRFHCQVGILAVKNHWNSIYPHRYLYMWLGVNHAFTTGMNELSALTASICTLKSRIFLRACMRNLWPCDNGKLPCCSQWTRQSVHMLRSILKDPVALR